MKAVRNAPVEKPDEDPETDPETEPQTEPETDPDEDPEKKKEPDEVEERVLYLDGTIAEESWFDDEVSPEIFRDELNAGTGDISVWINSPGGDCVAAAQIYNMLKEYKGAVTVKIDGLAASAASVIAMAGDTVLMSPVSTMMIHNPSTATWGDSAEMQKAIQMLDEVKESIINAYELKTGMNRKELSKLMDSEYWMNANEALNKGFIDGILYTEDGEGFTTAAPAASMGYSPAQVTNSIMEKIAEKCKIQKPAETGRKADELMDRLNLIHKSF
ncbi:MAG: ATP-dependent Clp protease proteolytic subunit [Bacteroidales bacterium]|nr:ATP-dependent Clp protease proteolytic subunit [Bacteroidales bacterium]